MKVILDTNVFISGVFFSGVPHVILDAWRNKRITLVLSEEILEEYRQVGDELAQTFPAVDPQPALELVAIHATIVESPPLSVPVCTDPDDDKFLACAIASNTKIITSGDKALLRTSGYADIEVMTPRAFVDRYLSTTP
jgi:putative PIN family toxin of toxin-antitoxin system